jgi:hypothetical protein
VDESVIHNAWAHLRDLAKDGTKPIPPEPNTAVITMGSRTALDIVVNWCRGPCLSKLHKSKRSSNDPRDTFCYYQLKKGTSLKDIKIAVQKRKEWEPLNSEQAVWQAARRYAIRKGLPWPIA